MKTKVLSVWISVVLFQSFLLSRPSYAEDGTPKFALSALVEFSKSLSQNKDVNAAARHLVTYCEQQIWAHPGMSFKTCFQLVFREFRNTSYGFPENWQTKIVNRLRKLKFPFDPLQAVHTPLDQARLHFHRDLEQWQTKGGRGLPKPPAKPPTAPPPAKPPTAPPPATPSSPSGVGKALCTVGRTMYFLNFLPLAEIVLDSAASYQDNQPLDCPSVKKQLEQRVSILKQNQELLDQKGTPSSDVSLESFLNDVEVHTDNLCSNLLPEFKDKCASEAVPLNPEGPGPDGLGVRHYSPEKFPEGAEQYCKEYAPEPKELPQDLKEVCGDVKPEEDLEVPNTTSTPPTTMQPVQEEMNSSTYSETSTTIPPIQEEVTSSTYLETSTTMPQFQEEVNSSTYNFPTTTVPFEYGGTRPTMPNGEPME